jgi:two-component system chemotaxis response regulator CheY
MALILVIDDESGIRNFVKLLLEEEGHSVLEAEDGDVGFQLFRRHNPEVVIVDLFMPAKDGLETIREIVKQSPAVKIIAMSGGGTFGIDLLEIAGVLGATKVMRKPFQSRELLDAVKG